MYERARSEQHEYSYSNRDRSSMYQGPLDHHQYNTHLLVLLVKLHELRSVHLHVLVQRLKHYVLGRQCLVAVLSGDNQ